MEKVITDYEEFGKKSNFFFLSYVKKKERESWSNGESDQDYEEFGKNSKKKNCFSFLREEKRERKLVVGW